MSSLNNKTSYTGDKIYFQSPYSILEFRKYLPILPPNCTEGLPFHLKQYLVSKKFAILSTDSQNKIKQKIKIAYRGCYSLPDIIQYLNTLDKFDETKIKVFLNTYSSRYQMIDWYKLVRVTYKASRAIKYKRIFEKEEAATFIKQKFKNWLEEQKRKEALKNQIIEIEKPKPDQKIVINLLRKRFGSVPQSLRQIFVNMDKNGDGTIDDEQFQTLLTKDLHLQLDKDVIKKTFNFFDKQQRGYFKYENFLAFLFQTNIIKSLKGYINTDELIVQQISIDLHSTFESDIIFEQNFLQDLQVEGEYSAQFLFCYLDKLYKNKYSKYQIQKINKYIVDQKYIKDLYNKTVKIRKIKQQVEEDVLILYKEIKNPCLNNFIKIIYSLLSQGDQNKKYYINDLLNLTKDFNYQLNTRAFFYFFKITNYVTPKYMRQILKINSITSKMYLFKNMEEQKNIFEQAREKYTQDMQFGYRQTKNIIEQLFHQKLTLRDEQFLNINPKLSGINFRQVLDTIFDFKLEKIITYIYKIVGLKFIVKWKSHKQNNRKIQLQIQNSLSKMITDTIKTLPPPKKQSKRSIGFRQKSTVVEKKEIEIVSDFKSEVPKLIDNIIQGFANNKISKKLSLRETKKNHLFLKNLNQFSYRTNLTHFSINPIIGTIFMNNNIFVYGNGKNSQINLKLFLRPHEEILDFLAYHQKIYILTTSLHVQIIQIFNDTTCPIMSISINESNEITNWSIQKLYKYRFYNRFPFFLKRFGQQIFVNATFANNKLYVIDIASNQIINRLYFNPDNYIIEQQQQKIITKMKQILIRQETTISQVLKIKTFPFPRQQLRKKLLMNFDNLKKYPHQLSTLLNLISHQEEINQLQYLFLVKILQVKHQIYHLSNRFIGVHKLIVGYLQENNLTVIDLIKELDPRISGVINYKILKSFLNKILSGEQCQNIEEILGYIDSSGKISYNKFIRFLQSVRKPENFDKNSIQFNFIALINKLVSQNRLQKHITRQYCKQLFFKYLFQFTPQQIQDYLQRFTYSKTGQISLQSIISSNVPQVIFWKRSKLIIQDFIYIPSYRILIYTIIGSNSIYIISRDNKQSETRILCKLEGHQCSLPPTFIFVQQNGFVISGDKSQPQQEAKSNIYIWSLYGHLIERRSMNPPWKISPFKVIQVAHNNSIVSLSYLNGSNILTSTSIDSTIKYWTYEDIQDSFKEIKRIYLNEMICLEIGIDQKHLNSESTCSMETIICYKVEKVQNKGNKNRIAAVAQYIYIENLNILIGEEQYKQKIPLKLIMELNQLGGQLYNKKQKLEKMILFKHQKSFKNGKILQRSFFKFMYRVLKNIIIFNKHEDTARLYNWAKQLFKGITLEKFKFWINKFGIKVNFQTERIHQLHNLVNLLQEGDETSIMNSTLRKTAYRTIAKFNYQAILNNLSTTEKQELLSRLETINKKEIFENEFYELFKKYTEVQKDELNIFFEKYSQQLDKYKFITSQTLMNLLRKQLHLENNQSPFFLLRKLIKNIKRVGLQPEMVFNLDKKKLSIQQIITPEEFRENVVSVANLSNSQAQILIQFLKIQGSISLKYYLAQIRKAQGYKDLSESHLMQTTPIKKQLLFSKRDSKLDSSRIQDAAQIQFLRVQSDIKNPPIKEEKSVRNNQKIQQQNKEFTPPKSNWNTLNETSHQKNFDLKGNQAKIMIFQEYLKDNKQILTKILQLCKQNEHQPGKIRIVKFKEILVSYFDIDEVQQLIQQIRKSHLNKNLIQIQYASILMANVKKQRNYQEICLELYQAIKANPLNVTQKEFLKVLKIEEISKGKLQHLIKKCKVKLTGQQQQKLSIFLKCQNGISINDFLTKISPKKFAKSGLKQKTINTLIKYKDKIIQSILETVQSSKDFNVLEYIPFPILQNILINPLYSISSTELTKIDTYTQKLTKQNNKFNLKSQSQNNNTINALLFFAQLQRPPAQDTARSGSETSSNKQILRRISSNNNNNSNTKSQRNMSNSMISSKVIFQNQTYIRIQDIITKLQNRLVQINKTIWQILSMINPDWLDSDKINKRQFFTVIDTIDNRIKLKDKVDLLRFCDKQRKGQIEIEQLLDSFEGKIKESNGEKYILIKISNVIETKNLKLQQIVADFYQKQGLKKQKLSVLQLSDYFKNEPFNLHPFVTKQIFKFLSQYKKISIDQEEFIQLIKSLFNKFGIQMISSYNIIKELVNHMEVNNVQIQHIFPLIGTNVKINMQYVIKQLLILQISEEDITRFWKVIIDKVKTQKKMTEKKILSYVLLYPELIKIINQLIQQQTFSKNREVSIAKRISKAIESKKITLLEFFFLIDRNKKYQITEFQLNNGLRELGIYDNIWKNIKKKKPKWLTFAQFVYFLIDKEAVDINIADTALEVAMNNFLRKLLRDGNMEKLYSKFSTFQGKMRQNVNWQSFQRAFQSIASFAADQIKTLFCAFVNADQITAKILGNDSLLKNQDNLNKTFSYRMFVKLIYYFEKKNIKKTSAFRFYDFLMKRKVSLFQQMMSYMQRNKKVKEIAEALKNKELVLSKQRMKEFILEFKSGLLEKQINQMLFLFEDKIKHNDFQSKLQDIYKSATNEAVDQEVMYNAKVIYHAIKNMNTNTERLFEDFNKNHKINLNLVDFNTLCQFLNCGLNKIQIKQLFYKIDDTHRGYITSNELNGLFEQAFLKIQKQQQDIEIDYILEKIIINKSKYKLPNLNVTITEEGFENIFSKVLSKEEIQKLKKQMKSKFGEYITSKNLMDYMEKYTQQNQTNENKKIRVIITKITNFLNIYRMGVRQLFFYFTSAPLLKKSDFFVLFQTFPMKFQINQINSLYKYFDENRGEGINVESFEYKIDLIILSNFSNSYQSAQTTKLYYKTKLKLQQIYLYFVKKLFMQKQIFSFFDRNNSGELASSEFISLLRQLNISLTSEQEKKLIKYLIKQEKNTINIHHLIKQFKSCLPNKTKIILETKIFQIFKQHQNVLQQQPDLFIDKLITNEIQVHHLDRRNKEQILKGIKQKQFFTLLKEFGILLNEEELEDVKNNFSLNSQTLDLVKIYWLFDSILLAESKQQKTLQIQRYKKILNYMKKNAVTIIHVEQLMRHQLSVRSLENFLSSLNILRPIQVKRIVEPLIIPGTTLIDFPLFKQNILASYYQQHISRQQKMNEIQKNIQIIQNNKQKQKQDLKASRKFKTKLLKNKNNSSYWINEFAKQMPRAVFQKSLKNNSVIISKKQLNNVFNQLSNQTEYLQKDSVSILFNQKKTETDDKQKEIEKFKISEVNQKLEELYEHILASINFKNVSLLEALRQYKCGNEGIVPISQFIDFLNDTGYRETTKQDLIQLLKQEDVIINNNDLNIIRLQNIFDGKGMKIVKLSQYEHIKWLSKEFYQINKILKKYKSDIYNEIKNLANIENKVHYQQVYKLLKKIITNPKHDKPIQLLINIVFTKPEENINEILSKLVNQLKNHQNYPFQQFQINQTAFETIINQINFLTILFKITDTLYSELDKLNASRSFTEKMRGLRSISNILLIQKIESMLQADTIVPPIQSQIYYIDTFNFHPINLYSQIIVKFEQFQRKNDDIFLINKKYQGYLDKKLCEDRLRVETILNNPPCLYKINKYYCVQSHTNSHSSGAIFLNWKFIGQFGRKILEQFNLVHKHGYCLANLRWENLQQRFGIKDIRFPCKINSSGQLSDVPKVNIDKNHPYVAPQFIFAQNYDIKVDSWLFGCIMFEFIFGCSPPSLYTELRNSLGEQALTHKIKQLPYNFQYKWINEQMINEIVDLEHSQKIRDISFIKIQRNKDYFKNLFRRFQHIYNNEQFEKQLEQLIEIVKIIDKCFKFEPRLRPTTEQLLKQKIFIENSNIDANENLQGLERYIRIRNFNSEIFQKIKTFMKKSEVLQKSQQQQIVLIFSQFLKLLQKSKTEYFPDKILQFKAQITKPLNQIFYTKTKMYKKIELNIQNRVIHFIFKNHLLSSMVYLTIKSNSAILYKTLLQIFNEFANQLKSYTSVLVYYIEQFLVELIKICLGQFISLKTYQHPELTLFLKSNTNQQFQTSYLNTLKIKFNYTLSKEFVSLYRLIIGQNGIPSINYLPIFDFIHSDQNFRNYNHAMYNIVSLYSSFKDNNEQKTRELVSVRIQYLMNVQRQKKMNELKAIQDAKCPLFFINILNSRDQELRSKALIFYEYLSIESIPNPIFFTKVLHLSLFGNFRLKQQNLFNKVTALKIFKNLIDYNNQQIIQNLNSGYFNIYSQILRLSIQPKTNTIQYSIYQQLKPYLESITGIFKNEQNLKISRVINNIAGSQSILFNRD